MTHSGFNSQMATLAVLWKTDLGGARAEAGSSLGSYFGRWGRDVGRTDECGVDGGGDMRSNKGWILKLEPTEIANGSEVDVRDTTMTNSSSSS